MKQVSRRSFLASSVSAAAAASCRLTSAQVPEDIPGFDQTSSDFDRTKAWQPFSDRKVRVGIVGHGVCQFGLAFDLQHHPNVELVAVSDLFPDRCADMARKAKCEKTYPSLEEMVKDDSIEAIYCATDAPAHAKHAILCMEHGKHVATAVPAFPFQPALSSRPYSWTSGAMSSAPVRNSSVASRPSRFSLLRWRFMVWRRFFPRPFQKSSKLPEISTRAVGM